MVLVYKGLRQISLCPEVVENSFFLRPHTGHLFFYSSSNNTTEIIISPHFGGFLLALAANTAIIKV